MVSLTLLGKNVITELIMVEMVFVLLNVKISLFNGFGALLAQEITGMQNAGTHTRSLNMSQMPRGTYIVKITTGSYREARPINITR